MDFIPGLNATLPTCALLHKVVILTAMRLRRQQQIRFLQAFTFLYGQIWVYSVISSFLKLRYFMEMAEWQTCFGPASRWSEFSFDNMALSEATLAGRPVYLSAACPSTMDLAWELEARHQFFDMSWITAITQTRGRGQANRPWRSAPAACMPPFACPFVQQMQQTTFPWPWP